MNLDSDVVEIGVPAPIIIRAPSPDSSFSPILPGWTGTDCIYVLPNGLKRILFDQTRQVQAAAQFSTALHGFPQFAKVLHGSPGSSTVLHGSPQSLRFSKVLQGHPRFSTVLDCVLWFSTVLHSSPGFFSEPFFNFDGFCILAGKPLAASTGSRFRRHCQHK